MSAFLRLATAGARVAGAAERALTTGATVLREATHGVLARSLDREEREALGVALYEARLGRVRSALAPWEEEWLAADLPPAPARVLVGGAEDGRDAIALVASGYSVGAFDPGSGAVDACRRALPAGSSVARATYQDLSRAVLDHEPPAEIGAIATREWDAVLLGWTSVMHVL